MLRATQYERRCAVAHLTALYLRRCRHEPAALATAARGHHDSTFTFSIQVPSTRGDLHLFLMRLYAPAAREQFEYGSRHGCAVLSLLKATINLTI